MQTLPMSSHSLLMADWSVVTNLGAKMFPYTVILFNFLIVAWDIFRHCGFYRIEVWIMTDHPVMFLIRTIMCEHTWMCVHCQCPSLEYVQLWGVCAQVKPMQRNTMEGASAWGRQLTEEKLPVENLIFEFCSKRSKEACMVDMIAW